MATTILGLTTFTGSDLVNGPVQISSGIAERLDNVFAGTHALGGAIDLNRAGAIGGLRNTNDGASSKVFTFAGDRATMGANDEAYVSLELSDDAGAQTEAARLTWVATAVTAGAVAGRLDFAVRTAGTLANELQLDGTALAPSASDGLALGTASLQWSDLFLASGSVINWNNGDLALTHTADTLTLTGGGLVIGAGALTGLTGFALRDTSAAYDVTLAAVSSAALTAGRTLTLDMGNVAHTLKFGTTANTITFPNAASGTVPLLNLAQSFTAAQTFAAGAVVPAGQLFKVDSLTDAAGAYYLLRYTTTGIATFGDSNVDIQWGKALVALGGGSAPTLGTIGGSGPATAGQNSWLRLLDSTGAACWVPVWK